MFTFAIVCPFSACIPSSTVTGSCQFRYDGYHFRNVLFSENDMVFPESGLVSSQMEGARTGGDRLERAGYLEC